MSLEATLIETNTLLQQLIAVVTTGIEARETLGASDDGTTPKATRTRKSKADAAPAGGEQQPAVLTDTKPNGALGLVEGDPEGTRYFVIEKHNTVYAQKPGDPDCSIAGAEIVSAAHYLERKAEFAKKSQASSQDTKSEQPTGAAGNPAQPSPGASSASSATSSDVPFAKITALITDLMQGDVAKGQGRPAVLAILKKYLPDNPKPSVTLLQPLGRNAEILADIEKALGVATPAADEEFDPLA